MVALTDSAVSALTRVVATSVDVCCGLRIMVEAADCSGPKYLMGVENEAMAGDTILEFGDLKVFIDEDSHPLIRGTRIDFVDDDALCGFTFENPNFLGLCHCDTLCV